MMEEERDRTPVLLVGADTGEEDFESSMEELRGLACAAGRRVVGVITQQLERANKAFCIGSGKVGEVREFAEERGAEEIVFDNALSPSQIRNLAQELALPVFDRTNLILDIFALRARTREAKLQVETARLQYMLPRLVGMHESLSRQGGASGSMSSKGTGEKKLELDRRRIEHRISVLRTELEQIASSRETMRKKRGKADIPQVALVGYTNAGKSTILNRMASRFGETPEKQVCEEDMLFATLETSVRAIDDEEHKPLLMIDTVGFIHKLPHGLVQAFRSTLEEVCYADLLVQVVDFSDENHRQHMRVTEQTLKELNAGDIPMLTVYNKADKCGMAGIPRVNGDAIYMAAGSGVGVEELLNMIRQKVYADYIDCCFKIPYDRGEAASYLSENGTVSEREYREDGILLWVSCRRRDADRYRELRIPTEVRRS